MARRRLSDTWAVLMMAGMGTRMKSSTPKVLHEVCGMPIAWWVLKACDDAGVNKRVVVIGHGAEEVKKSFPDEVFAVQLPQLGTGHAVTVGLRGVPASAKHVLVLSGDVPCLKSSSLRSLIDYHRKVKPSATVLTFEPPDPSGYGRMVRDENGSVWRIVEHKDLKGDQRDIEECNSGIYVFNREALEKSLGRLKRSERSREYHLPDVLHLMIATGGRVESVQVCDWIEAIGVNTRLELSEASDYLRWQIAERHMADGVTIVDPGTTWIGPSVSIGEDTVIHPGSIIMGETSIGGRCSIGPYTELHDVTVGAACRISHSVLEKCTIESHVRIGPYAHIRPGSTIRTGAKIGNFVELKKTDFGRRSKSGHLTYLGDTIVGSDVNIGAGTITCNFDGEKKNITEIEDGVFIGSDTILVAPVKIGKNAYTAAGSTLNRDVPPNALAFGRARQTIKEGWVKPKKKKKQEP